MTNLETKFNVLRCNYQSGYADFIKSDTLNVKGRLKQHNFIFYEIGASPMVINEGYRIPFTNELPPMLLNNNKSALLEYVFVTESITELLSSNRITEKHQPSYITSPVSVAYQASGKKRLIHDLSKFVNKIHFKLDDWKIGLQYFLRYLDDGFTVIPKATDDAESNLIIAQTIYKHIKVNPLKNGLVCIIYNIEKSSWDPHNSHRMVR